MATDCSIISPRTLRVLAVGDCNTSGITVPPVGNTIVDEFCRNLERQGYRTASQNLGYGMATTREGVRLMQSEAQAADVVLINFGLVDTWITSIPRCYISYFPENFVKKRARKFLKFVKRRLRTTWLRPLVPVGPVVPIDEYDRNIRTIIAQAQAKHPGTTILIWGSPPVQGNSSRNRNLQRYNEQLQAIARETGASYLSTSDIVADLPPGQAYLDAVHLGESACQRIAAGLFEAYQSQQFAVAS